MVLNDCDVRLFLTRERWVRDENFRVGRGEVGDGIVVAGGDDDVVVVVMVVVDDDTDDGNGTDADDGWVARRDTTSSPRPRQSNDKVVS